MQTNIKTVEDILFEEGKLTADKLSLVKLEAVNSGRPVEDIIAEHNFVSSDDLAAARAKVLGIPFVSLRSKPIPADTLVLIPEPVARRYILIPFEYDKSTNTLSVAMYDPLDLQVIEFIEKKSKAKIKPFIATLTDIKDAIDEQYAQSLTTEVTAALKEAGGVVEAKEEITDLTKVEEVIREAPVAKIISTLLEFAIKGRASDIHIEPLEDKTRIRYRIDGVLQERLVVPKKVHDALISRVKILSGLKIDERRLPQDGRFTFKIGSSVVDLRISTLPTVHGEKIVMRLLPKTTNAPTLGELGLRGTALKTLEENILKPYGIVLVTGPTGSGKTTTLFSILSKINSLRVNIVTIEDPVEYQIPGVNQLQINPTAGLTFASGLRSFLRQDPNIIMVGEVRDSETASLAIQASLTGHLVFSTLHTNNAAGALPRLLDMAVETFLLASSMSAIVAQRVVRKICTNCKETYDPPPQIIEDVKNALGKLLAEDLQKMHLPGDANKFKLQRGKGCDVCADSGYFGRIGIFEVLGLSEKIGRLILEHAPANEIEKQAVDEGMITMIQDGYLKSIEGITTVEEVLRVSSE